MCGPAPALTAQRFEQVKRFDFAARAHVMCDANDLLHPRSHQDSFPTPIFTGAERPAHGGMHLADIDPVALEPLHDRRIALLQQRHEQMLGTDVVMIVIARLLLGGMHDPPSCRAES